MQIIIADTNGSLANVALVVLVICASTAITIKYSKQSKVTNRAHIVSKAECDNMHGS